MTRLQQTFGGIGHLPVYLLTKSTRWYALSILARFLFNNKMSISGIPGNLNLQLKLPFPPGSQPKVKIIMTAHITVESRSLDLGATEGVADKFADCFVNRQWTRLQADLQQPPSQIWRSKSRPTSHDRWFEPIVVCCYRARRNDVRREHHIHVRCTWLHALLPLFQTTTVQ